MCLLYRLSSVWDWWLFTVKAGTSETNSLTRGKEKVSIKGFDTCQRLFVLFWLNWMTTSWVGSKLLSARSDGTTAPEAVEWGFAEWEYKSRQLWTQASSTLGTQVSGTASPEKVRNKLNHTKRENKSYKLHAENMSMRRLACLSAFPLFNASRSPFLVRRSRSQFSFDLQAIVMKQKQGWGQFGKR